MHVPLLVSVLQDRRRRRRSTENMTIKKKSLDFEISGDRETTFERTTPKLIH
jgi:hypothetical protein